MVFLLIILKTIKLKKDIGPSKLYYESYIFSYDLFYLKLIVSAIKELPS